MKRAGLEGEFDMNKVKSQVVRNCHSSCLGLIYRPFIPRTGASERGELAAVFKTTRLISPAAACV